uniref:Xylanase inhibitor N-terminal domain-containing protein n=1 Tax=Oryza glumipatula TaxID=40148 RepID=A0A0D9ZV35_9ORYZ
MRGASRLAVVVGREEGASSPVDGVASDEAGFREGGERSAARRRSERFPRVRGARRRELLRFFPVERARLERASEAASDPLAHAVLSFYDLENSQTGQLLPCSDVFCKHLSSSTSIPCQKDHPCIHFEKYGTENLLHGKIVQDFLVLEIVINHYKTSKVRTKVQFGSISQHLKSLSSSFTVDGVMGLGPSNTSLVYQLAKSQKWKKMFAHCLDGKRSGGIFVLGHIVGPKVRKTPLDQTRTTLLEITVGETSLSLSAGNVEIKSQNMTILETGSLISYLPEKIFSDLEDISVINIGGYSCFHYERRFPEVVFHFKELLTLRVYPHEYMFHNMEEHYYCLGFLSSEQRNHREKDLFILGGKSSVHVRDEPTGKIYEVGSHRMNSDDDEDVWSHDRVKLETEHTTPANNTSEKTEVHSGLLSHWCSGVLRETVNNQAVCDDWCDHLLRDSLGHVVPLHHLPSIYQLEKYEYAEMVVGSSCGGDFGYHCRVHSFVDKAHRHCFPQI